MSRRRSSWVAIVLLGLALAASFLVAPGAQRSTGTTVGNVFDAGHATSMAFPIDRGVTATLGTVILVNRSNSDVTMTGAALVDARGLSFAGAMLHPLDLGEGAPLGDTRYPPAGITALALPRAIPPSPPREDGGLEAEYQLLIGVTMDTDDIGSARGVQLFYRQNGSPKRQVISAGMTLCTPRVNGCSHNRSMKAEVEAMTISGRPSRLALTKSPTRLPRQARLLARNSTLL